MKPIFHIFLILGALLVIDLNESFAQTPKIALVKPDGTTTIHTTFQQAYDASEDDDYIYLPGGLISFDDTLNKKLHILGAGSFIDSSLVTNRTTIHSLRIGSGAEGGSVEGIYFSNPVPGSCLHGSINFEQAVSNFTINYCYLTSGISCSTSSTNIVIINNIIGSSGCGSVSTSIKGNFTNSFISNNIIFSTLGIPGEANIEFNNNIFFYNQQFYSLNLPNSSIYNNNIGQQITTYSNNSVFNNNANMYPNGQNNIINNQISESFPEIFENPGNNPPWYGYEPSNDYHVKITSQCKNSGTDGTDRGMYGGTFPWVEGMVPSNPHIYYKSVSPQTTPNGQLHVHFRVRTGN